MGNRIESNRSEVARLMAQIDAENESARLALSGFQVGATRHAFITARAENIGQIHENLIDLVGEQEAARLICTWEPSSSQSDDDDDDDDDEENDCLEEHQCTRDGSRKGNCILIKDHYTQHYCGRCGTFFD